MQEYNETDQKLHLLTQVIAKVNRTFVEKKEDDSHTNLGFDSLGKKITGRWFKQNNTNYLFTLNLNEFTFELIGNDYKAIFSVEIDSKNINDIEYELTKELNKIDIVSNDLFSKLHYDIPDYSFKNDSFKKLSNLDEWLSYRSLANESCLKILDYLQVKGEIRIWPHHFDTGIYIEPNDSIGFGFGLAMVDDLIKEPYFYLTAYRKSGEIDYQKAEKLGNGEWKISEGFKGSILKLSELENKLKSDSFDKPVESFIIESFGFLLNNKK